MKLVSDPHFGCIAQPCDLHAGVASKNKEETRKIGNYGPTMECVGAQLLHKCDILQDYRVWLMPSRPNLDEARLMQGCLDETGKERMRIERLGFQLRVELYADEPRMIRALDDFRKQAIG